MLASNTECVLPQSGFSTYYNASRLILYNQNQPLWGFLFIDRKHRLEINLVGFFYLGKIWGQ